MGNMTNDGGFQFHNEAYLYYLLVLLVPIAVFILAAIINKMRLKRFGDPHLTQILMPEASKARQMLKIVLATLSLALIIIALARPQIKTETGEYTSESSEITVALDVSNSMLAQDIKPNRLENAKKAIQTLLRKTDYSNRVGLIVFAGEAYTQIPISSDYTAADLFLSVVSTDMVPVQGTNIRAAIELASKSFGPDTEAGKAIILITDGEDHEPEAIEAAEDAADKGIKIYTVGMGKKKAVPITNPKTGDYKKDAQGNTVLTKLNEGLLKQIAAAGEGFYTPGNYINSAIETVTADLEKLKKSKSKKEGFIYDELFKYPIAAALILLVLEFIVLERKNKYLKNIRLFD
jgi:Ca-activated chloride channel homolog